MELDKKIKKDYRPFTNDEFLARFKVGDVINYRILHNGKITISVISKIILTNDFNILVAIGSTIPMRLSEWFSEKENDHKTLANIYKMLDNKGVKEILTNHNTSLVRELYAGYNITEVVAQRSINCDGKKRVGKEIIITNF